VPRQRAVVAALRDGGARRLLPGLLLTAVLGAVSMVLGRVIPADVPDVTYAILLGLLLGNLVRLPDAVGPGLALAARRLLPIAIVLVGLQLSLRAVADVGAIAVIVAGLAVLTGLTVGVLLGRRLGVGYHLRLLIAAGTGICGNTAIITLAPVMRARMVDVTYAVAPVTGFGAIAVVVLPALGHLLDLSSSAFGLWAGAGVHDTSQVLAAGFAYDDVAGETATVTKLVRNLAIAPLVLVVSVLVRRAAAPVAADALPGKPRPPLVPLFLWGFLAAVALRSAGAVPDALLDPAREIAHALIVATIAAIGARTRFADLRTVGARPLLVGAITALAVSVVVLTAIAIDGA
jgi:uncharacterized integral membrane protein (TIGR00698 family)